MLTDFLRSKTCFLIAVNLLFLSSLQAETQIPCTQPTIKITYPASQPDPVFTFKTQRCNDSDFPDYPASAFRDKFGNVQLLAGNGKGMFRSTGSSLTSLTRQCNAPVFVSHHPEALPSTFENEGWLSNAWTRDGQTIYALVHNEFHGWGTEVNPPNHVPAHCNPVPEGGYNNHHIDLNCSFWNITSAKSTDAGQTYRILEIAPGQAQPIITTPHRYVPNGGNFTRGNLQSMAGNTNIVKVLDHQSVPYYYMLVQKNWPGSHGPRPTGMCLFRSPNPADPMSWRGWDGNTFTVDQTVSEYRDPAVISVQNLAHHTCTPLPTIAPGHTVESWTYNSVIHQFIATDRDVCYRKDPNGKCLEAWNYILSIDMIHWQPPVFLKQIVWLDQWSTSAPGSGVIGMMYPSLIDPGNEGTGLSGSHPYLYYTRFNPKQKPFIFDRDLVREQLSISCSQ